MLSDISRPRDLHPAPQEGIRDWDEKANRSQFRVPDDSAQPVLDAIAAYAESNNISWQEAYWIFNDGIDSIREFPPTWLK